MVAPVHVREGALNAAEDEDADVEQADLFGVPAAAATMAPTPRKPRGVLPAPVAPELDALAQRLPAAVHLGTSTWSFPGWRGIVYGDDYANAKLSRDGLNAYGAHPLLQLRIDRPIVLRAAVARRIRALRGAGTREHFRFIVKAPTTVTDAVVRGERGVPAGDNPAFLNAQIAIDEFVRAVHRRSWREGRRARVPVLAAARCDDRRAGGASSTGLSAFLRALPKPLEGESCYAVELRDAVMLTPRLIRALQDGEACDIASAMHARMPEIHWRQAGALALLDESESGGPLIVRWSLHGGFRYEQAKAKYEPFDQLVDEDPDTRRALAELAARYAFAGQPVVIAVNNKAEGSAPLTCFALAREIAAACDQR